MTLEPRLWNCARTSWLAPCPNDTMVVTAAMPMTTPRTVSPERSLFLPSWRSEMRSRSSNCTSLPRREGAFGTGDDRLSRGEVAGQHLRVLVLDQPERDGDGPQQLAVLDPDEAALALAGEFG